MSGGETGALAVQIAKLACEGPMYVPVDEFVEKPCVKCR